MTESDDPIEFWKKWLSQHAKKELNVISREYPHTRSLYIDLGKVPNKQWEEANDNPLKFIDDVMDAAKELLKPSDTVFKDLNVRIFGGGVRRRRIQDLRNADIRKLIIIDCLVTRVSTARPHLTTALFQCPAGHSQVRRESFGMMTYPDKCETQGCRFSTFEFLPRKSKFVDKQRVRLQDVSENMRSGEQPQSIDCIISDDLVNQVLPGQRIIAYLIPKLSLKKVGNMIVPDARIFPEIISFSRGEEDYDEMKISPEDEEKILALSKEPDPLQRISANIAPNIYGYEREKLAMALSLFSGIPKLLPDGSTLRGSIHVLVVGDPGIAKSQLLKAVARLSPRSIFVNALNTTTAGLTAAATKDENDGGRWVLEAGALVLADGGVACIDEIDKVKKEERAALNETMEQQTVSVAKAGISATLMARSSILATANPVDGRFDMRALISDQINLEPTLLSRFDLIFLLPDKPEENRDEQIARHILQTHMSATNKKVAAPPVPGGLLEPGMIRKYIAYSKQNCIPSITPEASEVLIRYYQKTRQLSGENKPVPITARALEATVRLAEAMARARLSETVTVTDAERSIKIFDECLREVAYDPSTGAFDVDRVMTGMPKSRRDLATIIIDTIKEIQSEKGSVRVNDVYAALKAKHLTFADSEIERVLEKLKHDGLILDNRGYLKVM